MSFKYLVPILSVVFLCSCTGGISDFTPKQEQAKIFPEYKGVTVPVNIAPLNFKVLDDCQAVTVVLKGRKGELRVDGKSKVQFPIAKWHQLLSEHAGDSLVVNIYEKNKGKLFLMAPFSIHISKNAIDPVLVYRLIAPGYESWSEMGIYQRNLTNFTQTPIVNTKLFPGSCTNCHSFRMNDPKQMMFHIRANNGGTILIQNEQIQKLETKTDSTISNCTYPYWHPSGKYIAFSVNNISQVFHASNEKRIEVVDSKSDVVVYDITKNQIVSSPLLKTPSSLETFPCFSPDGKTLFFCTSKARSIPTEFDKVKYNLCSISFDESTASFGNKVDTLVNAEKMDKSVSFPRVSPDGKYLLYTMAQYGNFSIWHKDADLYMIDLATHHPVPMDHVNSKDVDSYHSWSSNSCWMVFSSRRVDGLYTRPFICSVDENGKLGLPFMLPQENPDFYDSFLMSFNIPELVKSEVDVDAYKIEAVAKGGKGKQVVFKSSK